MNSTQECIEKYPDYDDVPVEECTGCKLRNRSSVDYCAIGDCIIRDSMQVRIP